MLALCSMLSRTYYAHFNAGIIGAPPAVKLHNNKESICTVGKNVLES